MKAKSITAFLLALLLILGSFSAMASFDDKDHNRWTETMIFANPSYKSTKPDDIKENLIRLEDALLICIDEFSPNSSKCQTKLDDLNAARIPNLPTDISAINFTAGNLHEEESHRAYTHRGWYHDYNSFQTEKSHPEIRKQILMSVVNFVFSFDKCYSDPVQAEKICDAMCCLLYNTHIIADRYHSTAYYGAVSTLPLAYSGAESVIQDLLECLPVLFPNQVRGNDDYSELTRKLKTMNDKIIRSHRADISKEEHLIIDQQYAKDLRDLLANHIPKLLRQQSWFTTVFPNEWSGSQFE